MDQQHLEMMQAQPVEGPGIVFYIVYFGFLALMFASMWKVFTKAGEPGWASIVPIYNAVVMMKIAGKPAWWVLLMLIPFVNFVVTILVTIELCKAFGKGTGFALGMIFLSPIFLPILAFGDAQYQGAARPALAA